MNKLLTGIVLLSFSIGAIAQEKQIWACQMEAGTVLNWEDSNWRTYGHPTTQLLLTLDGENSSFKDRDFEQPLECSFFYPAATCRTPSGAHYILIDTTTGKMGKSFLGAALKSGNGLSAQIFNCTKF